MVTLTMTTPFGFTDGNYVRWVNFGSWAGWQHRLQPGALSQCGANPGDEQSQYLYW